MKKFLSGLLAFVLFASLLPASALESAPIMKSGITFSAESLTVERGNEFTLTVSMAGNTVGLCGVDVVFEFDNQNIEAVSIKKARDAFYNEELDEDTLSLTKGNVVDANNTGSWKSPFAGADPSTYNGPLVVAKFKVKDTAPEGVYTVKLACAAYTATAKLSGINNVNSSINVVKCIHLEKDEWETEKEPTCTEKGLFVLKCSKCGEVMDSEDIKELGHDFDDWTETKPFSCTENGEETGYCTRENCNETDTRPVLAHHIEGETWETEDEGDCSNYGTDVKRCTVCNEVVDRRSKTEYGEHNIEGVEWETENAGDCCNYGTDVKRCSICDEVVDRRSKTEYGEHNIENAEWELTTNPTWEDEGVYTRYCEVDGCEHFETKKAEVGIISDIKIKTDPTVKNYQLGKAFNPAGLVVEVSYSNYNITTQITDFSGVDFSYDFSTFGEKEVTFNVLGKDLSITVLAEIPGDANGSGGIDTSDAITVLRYVASYEPEEMHLVGADVNNDDVVDTLDAIAVLRYIAGYRD